MKRFFPAIYIIWMSVLVFYVLVSACSYYSVLATFGSVPGNDSLYELARATHQQINTFPIEAGRVLIIFYFWGLGLIPFLLLINYVASRLDLRIRFEWKMGLVLIGIWITVLLLMNIDAQGWYTQFVLD